MENDGLAEEFSYPMSYREVIEVMHVHAFLVPLIIFVMSRILSMTGTGEGVKLTVYISAFIGTIMNLSGPYLTIYISRIFVISLTVSYVILGSCFIAFIFLPIGKMWSRKRAEETEYWL
ncbi:paraquat-inducible protein A [Candidatus Scalindua japonica]|uniref:Paraquat-inducible protein A n=1 Tax=Candidatus Scalindua japonica TaxID=1284222 RepID=A0A286TUT8_9BACT|nr:paraquat-inducible protein A [Candidatus Scalindua japonica]